MSYQFRSCQVVSWIYCLTPDGATRHLSGVLYQLSFPFPETSAFNPSHLILITFQAMSFKAQLSIYVISICKMHALSTGDRCHAKPFIYTTLCTTLCRILLSPVPAILFGALLMPIGTRSAFFQQFTSFFRANLVEAKTLLL